MYKGQHLSQRQKGAAVTVVVVRASCSDDMHISFKHNVGEQTHVCHSMPMQSEVPPILRTYDIFVVRNHHRCKICGENTGQVSHSFRVAIETRESPDMNSVYCVLCKEGLVAQINKC
jgi:hypothetical protein